MHVYMWCIKCDEKYIHAVFLSHLPLECEMNFLKI